LTLGIGANTAIFQLLDAVRLRSLPVREPHRLARIEIPGKGGFRISHYSDNVSYPLYQQVREQQQGFSGIFAWNSGYTPVRIGQGSKRAACPCLESPANSFPRSGFLPRQGGCSARRRICEAVLHLGVVLSYSSGKVNSAGISPLSARVWSFRIIRSKSLGSHQPAFPDPKSDYISISRCRYVYFCPQPWRHSAFDRRDYSWLNLMGRLKSG